MQKRLFLWMLGTFLSPVLGATQVDSLFAPAFLLEDQVQEEGIAESFDLPPKLLSALRKRPLNLNTATEQVLRESGLFSPSQIIHFLTYRDRAGPLLALYELQVIPGFEIEQIRQWIPYVTIGSELEDLHIPLKKLLTTGRNTLSLRWKRQLESKKGFLPAENSFLGDPNHLYLKFGHAYENRFSMGLTAEKDPGEEFFSGSNRHGFDFLSAHVFLRGYTHNLKALAIGDYSVGFGQGLILRKGFGYGKGPASMQINRSGRALSPFTSINESEFFRGLAATIAWGENWESTLFISSRKKDANAVDTAQHITSILLSGLHRTAAEIAGENAFQQYTTGGQIQRRWSRGHLSVNMVYDRFDKALEPNLQPYNIHTFSGKHLYNLSLDYGWRFRNIHFFGETACSQNGALATVNGILAGLDRKLDASLLIRHFPPQYQTLHAAPFSETTSKNETGIYLGLEIRPLKLIKINAYFDMWKHPWLRYQTDLPSYGSEWLIRLSLFRKRKWNIYWQMRGEQKERNGLRSAGKTNRLTTHYLLFSRLHFSFKISKALEWRTRLELGKFSLKDSPGVQTGVLLFQDLLFKPLSFPLSFTTRFGLFDTDSYDLRFYAYENGLLYNFSIPAYYDRGARFYLNIRYKGIRDLTMELRYASSFFPGNLEIGTGKDATLGDRRSNIGVQLRYSF